MERIFVGVAWPYANGPLHLGHVAGAYLPADIFARYHRLKGNEVLMVSGSDQHGTPITITAEQEGKTPGDIAAKYHRSFLQCWQKLGIEFDLFTTTGTAFFTTLKDKGYIYEGTMPLPYCDHCQRYLADRYVEGTCPFCGYEAARGDQCDRCGKPLGPLELINPACKTCGTRPRVLESKHFFLRLSTFETQLLEWVKQQTHWRQNVLNFTLRYLQDGLKDRAITRDIEWGIPVPEPGFEKKRIYVWFEAVIGYLSASKEWASLGGDPERWRSFWSDEARSYYFIGKDNIPFHTMIWPAMLMGYGGLRLPYDVPANEFLTIEGKKLSTSLHWAVWLPDYLERYEPDPLRYLLSINMPETADADFSWREFVRRNNDELVATYGNLVHRVLTFTQRQFGGLIPQPLALDDASKYLLEKARNTLDVVDNALYNCRFREGIRSAMSLAQEANRYLEEKSPWKMIGKDREMAGTAIFVSMCVVSCLKTVLYPFLPFSSQKLHYLLGAEGSIDGQGWRFEELTPGRKLPPPEPLFTKLEDKIITEENSGLGTAVV